MPGAAAVVIDVVVDVVVVVIIIVDMTAGDGSPTILCSFYFYTRSHRLHFTLCLVAAVPGDDNEDNAISPESMMVTSSDGAAVAAGSTGRWGGGLTLVAISDLVFG